MDTEFNKALGKMKCDAWWNLMTFSIYLSDDYHFSINVSGNFPSEKNLQCVFFNGQIPPLMRMKKSRKFFLNIRKWLAHFGCEMNGNLEGRSVFFSELLYCIFPQWRRIRALSGNQFLFDTFSILFCCLEKRELWLDSVFQMYQCAFMYNSFEWLCKNIGNRRYWKDTSSLKVWRQ